MLYVIAHFFRDRLPWLWNLIEILNSVLFSLRYGKRMSSIEVPSFYEGFTISPMRETAVEALVAFFARQPEDTYKFFKPHGFDVDSIERLQRNKAFLAYTAMDGSKVVGYCFIRAFFHGSGFRGRMVDINYRGKKLGTAMNRILDDVGFGIGLRLFETVNKDNVASYRSALAASKVKVIKEFDDGDLYLEIIADNQK